MEQVTEGWRERTAIGKNHDFSLHNLYNIMAIKGTTQIGESRNTYGSIYNNTNSIRIYLRAN
jgi:hypothetical protein